MATVGPVAPVIFQADQLRSQLDDLGVTDPGFRDFLFRKLIAEKPDYSQGTQAAKSDAIRAFKQIAPQRQRETITSDLGGVLSSAVRGDTERAKRALGKAKQKATQEFGVGTSESTVGQLSQMAAGTAPSQNEAPEGFGEALARTAGTLYGDAPLFVVGGAAGRAVGGVLSKLPVVGKVGQAIAESPIAKKAVETLARPILGEAGGVPLTAPATQASKAAAGKTIQHLGEEAVTNAGAFAGQQTAAQPVQLEAQARSLEEARAANQQQIARIEQALASRRKAYDQAIRDGRPKAELDALHAETIAPLEHDRTNLVAQNNVWDREIRQLREQRLASAGKGFSQGLVTGAFSGAAGVAGGTAAKGVGAFSKARVLPQSLATNIARGGAGVLAETEGEVQLNTAFDPTNDTNADRSGELMGFIAYRGARAVHGAATRAPGMVVRGIGKVVEGVKPGERTLNTAKDTAAPGQPKGLLVNLNEPMAGGEPTIQTEAPRGAAVMPEMPADFGRPDAPVAPVPEPPVDAAAPRQIPSSQPVILGGEGAPRPAVVDPTAERTGASLIAQLPEDQVDALLARGNTLSRADFMAAVEAKQRYLAQRTAVQPTADTTAASPQLILPSDRAVPRAPAVEGAPAVAPPIEATSVIPAASAPGAVTAEGPANPYLNAKDIETVRDAARQGVRLAQEALPVLEARDAGQVATAEQSAPNAPKRKFSALMQAKRERDAQAAKPKKLSEIIQTRKDRAAGASSAQPAVLPTAQSETPSPRPSIFGDVVETKHSQKGHALFVVPVNERVDRARFDELSKVAKSLGGYYSSFRKTGAVPGFQFKSREAAERFRSHQAGESATGTAAPVEGPAVGPGAEGPEHAPVAKPAKTNASKLRDQADKIEAKAEEEGSRDRKTNTHKRAQEAAHALKRAERERTLGVTMRNLADAQEEGGLQHLNEVSTRTHVEALETALRSGMYETQRRDGTLSKDRDPEVADIDRARYPYPSPHRAWLTSIIRAAEGKKGLVTLARRVQSRIRGGDDHNPRFTTKEDVALLEDFVKAAEKAGIAKFDVEHVKDALRDYRRMQAMGITSEAQLREALREYFPLREARRAEDPIKKAERELVGKKIPGYFPTPPELADRVAEAADIRDGMTVLEPSAGKGNLIEAVQRQGAKDVQVDALEVNHTLRTILEAKKAQVIGQDFTELDPGKTYDRIVMNPPFENGQDIAHVRQAYEHLKPGGRLVAIMSEGSFGRSDKQATEFRAWLDEVGGTSEKNPDGSFKSAERPTGVATRMVVIDKPSGATAPMPQADADVRAINAKTWYHGTDTEGLSVEKLDSTMTKADGLFGQGVYLTDNPEIAQGYADARSKRNGTPVIYQAKLDTKRVLDLEQPIPEEVAKLIQERADAISDRYGDDDVSNLTREAIKAPGATTENAWRALSKSVGELSHAESIPDYEFSEDFGTLAGELRRIGYDAITHTGGKRTGKNPHQVVIVLDPSDIEGHGKPNPIQEFAPRGEVKALPATNSTPMPVAPPKPVDLIGKSLVIDGRTWTVDRLDSGGAHYILKDDSGRETSSPVEGLAEYVAQSPGVAAERSGEPQKGISPKEKYRSLGPDEDPGNAIVDLERRAAADNQIKEAIGIGRVSERLAETVKQDVGVDVSGYEHIVTVDGLNHIRNGHTDPDIERGHQQVPITEADLARIPEIVRDFDQVDYFDRNDQPTRDPEKVAIIRYTKRVNGHYLYFEEIRTGRKKLAAKTFYKKAATKEGSLSAPMADENSSGPGRPTSETDSEQPSSDTVTPKPLAFNTEKEANARAKSLSDETGLLHQVFPAGPKTFEVRQTQVEGDRLPEKGKIPDLPLRDPVKQPRANSQNAEANRARLLDEIDQEITKLDSTEAEVISRLANQVDEAKRKPSLDRARQAEKAKKELDKAREAAEKVTFTLGRATFRVPRLPDTLQTFRDRISSLSKAALDVLMDEKGEISVEGALSAVLQPIVAAMKAIGVAVDLAKRAVKAEPAAQAPGKSTNFRRQPPKTGVPLMQSAKGALLKSLQVAGAVDRKTNEISRATFEKVLPGLEIKEGELAVGRKGFEGLTWLTKEAKTGNDLVDSGLEAVRKGLIDKYGLTEDQIKTLNAGRLEKIRIAVEGMDYVRMLSDLTPEDSRVVNAILTDADMDPGEWEALSEPIRNAVTHLGEEMVDVGLLSREAFERNRGQYLHSSYERHLTQRPLPAFFFKKIKLLGDELRLSGRTLEDRAQADWEELTRNWELVSRNDQIEALTGGQERNRGTAVIRDKETGRTLTVPIEGGKTKLGLDDYLARDWEVVGGKARTITRAFDPSFADAVTQDWETVGPEHPEQFWSKERDRVLLRNKATGEEISVDPKEAKNYLADWKVEGEKDGKTILSHQPKLLMRRRWSGDEKALLGYVEDVGFNVARTYDLISNDLATFKMFKSLASMPDTVSPERAADMSKEAAKEFEGKGWVLFEDTPLHRGSSVKKWGDLADRYVSPHMARHLKEMDRLSQPGPWKWLLSQWKLNKTGRSPVTHMNNVVANVALLNFAGADLMDLADVFTEIGKGEASEILRGARAHGVFDSDFISAELRRHQPGSIAEKRDLVPSFKGLGDELRAAVGRQAGDYALFRNMGDEMRQALNQVGDKGIGTLEAAWTLVKRGDQFMQDMYQFEDLIFRLAVYKNRVEAGMNPEAAAGEARKWFLDYDIDAPWVNRARETLLPFAAWPYRAVPRVIESAMTRPWIWGKYVVLSAGLTALGMLGVGMAGHETEKMVLPPHMQGGKLFPNAYRVPGPKGAGGESLWLDASRWRLLGDVVDLGEGRNSALPFLPQALMPSGPLASLAAWIANRDLFTWKPIDDEAKGLPWGENVAKWAYAQIAPNAPWVPMSPAWNKWTSAKDGLNLSGGEESSLPLALLSDAGLKLSPVSLKRASAQVWKYTTLAQQADAVVRSEAFKLRNGATTPEQYRRAADAARAVNLKQIELALEYARRFEKLQGKRINAEATLPTQQKVASAIADRARTAGTVAAVTGADMMKERARLEAELKRMGVSPQVMGLALNAFKSQYRGSTRGRLKDEARAENFRGGLLGGLD